MWEIKEYKELTTIQLFEWEVNTTITIEDFNKILNNEQKFIRIWNEIIAKNQIKRCFVRSVDWIDNYILSLTKDDQDKLSVRLQQKKDKIWRGWDSIKEIQNFLDNKKWEWKS